MALDARGATFAPERAATPACLADDLRTTDCQGRVKDLQGRRLPDRVRGVERALPPVAKLAAGVTVTRHDGVGVAANEAHVPGISRRANARRQARQVAHEDSLELRQVKALSVVSPVLGQDSVARQSRDGRVSDPHCHWQRIAPGKLYLTGVHVGESPEDYPLRV